MRGQVHVPWPLQQLQRQHLDEDHDEVVEEVVVEEEDVEREDNPQLDRRYYFYLEALYLWVFH